MNQFMVGDLLFQSSRMDKRDLKISLKPEVLMKFQFKRYQLKIIQWLVQVILNNLKLIMELIKFKIKKEKIEEGIEGELLKVLTFLYNSYLK
jgi:very-short-patch-repair endonuclease